MTGNFAVHNISSHVPSYPVFRAGCWENSKQPLNWDDINHYNIFMIFTIKTFLLHQENSHPHEKLSHLSVSNTCWCEEKSLEAQNVLDVKSVIWEHLKCCVMFWCWFDNPQLSLATYFQFCLWTVRQSRGRDGVSVRYVLLCQEISRFCSFCHCKSLNVTMSHWNEIEIGWMKSWIRFPDLMLTSL